MMLCTSAGYLDLLEYVPDHPGVAMASSLASSIEAEGIRFIWLMWLPWLEAAARRPKDLLDLSVVSSAIPPLAHPAGERS